MRSWLLSSVLSAVLGVGGTRRSRAALVSLLTGLTGTFVGTQWSSSPPATKPVTVIQTPDQATWKVCFTPAQSCLPLIIKEIDSARESIRLQGYGFTSRPIAEALIRAHQRGVKVVLLLDKSQRKDQRSQYQAVKRVGIRVRFDAKPAIAHNKVIVIDNQKTVTGSYNWTKGAEFRNAENILVIDHKEMAKLYAENFDRRWTVSG